MFTYNYFENNSIISESRVKNVTVHPKTLESLYGMDCPANKGLLKEPVAGNELQVKQAQYDVEWNLICNSNTYCHLRICGRAAQDKSESEAFLLDDLFRLYRYNLSVGYLSTRSDMKINYNDKADLWVFYISPKLERDKERYIWIQPPKHNGSIRAVLKGLDKRKGILLEPYDRNKSGFKLIDLHLNKLQDMIKSNYDLFNQAIFEEPSKFFKDVAGRNEAKPDVSNYEWPYKLLYK